MNLQKIPDKLIELARENRELKAELEKYENINSGVFDAKFYSECINRAYKQGYNQGFMDGFAGCLRCRM